MMSSCQKPWQLGNTADRKEYINSFIYFSVADLNEDDENLIHNFIKLVEKFSSN